MTVLPPSGSSCLQRPMRRERPAASRMAATCSGTGSPCLHQLADDADRDLFRGLGADGKPNRRYHPATLPGVEAFLAKGLEQGLPFTMAAEQADEAGCCCQTATHGSEVVLVTR